MHRMTGTPPANGPRLFVLAFGDPRDRILYDNSLLNKRTAGLFSMLVLRDANNPSIDVVITFYRDLKSHGFIDRCDASVHF